MLKTNSAVKPKEEASLKDRAVPKPDLGQGGKPQPKDESQKTKTKKGAKVNFGQETDDLYSLLEGATDHHGLVEQLRDTYINYNQLMPRCQIQMKPKKQGEQFQKYYYQANNPFLEEPEKQKIFRKNYIDDVTNLPEPEPLFLLADKLQLDAADAIGDTSNPHDQRILLSKFFTRRTAQLQHKKHKILARWANSSINAYQIDQISAIFDKSISILQQEQDSCVNRLSRLTPDDKYRDADIANRPQAVTSNKMQATSPEKDPEQLSNKRVRAGKAGDDIQDKTLLYIEKKNVSINSSITQDDFEVFFRVQTYKNKTLRIAKKLITNLKWLSMTNRFDIWKDSRIKMFQLKTKQQSSMEQVYLQVCDEIRKKLRGYEIVEDKAVQAVLDRYTFHLKHYKKPEFQPEQLLQSHISDSISPPIIFVGNAELKITLRLLAREFPQVTCTQLDIDNGQKFSFSLQSFFPNKFEEQVRLMQFDQEDTGFNPDQQLIERLQNSLQISKSDLLQTITTYADKIRRNSIMGTLSVNVNLHQQEDNALKDSSKQVSHEEFARLNLIKKIRTVEFFSLEEIKTKLRNADWLEYVCFSPNVSEVIKQQNCILSDKDNHLDALLKSALEFTDVNDSNSVNKILDDASNAHIQKIKNCQQKIKEGKQPSKVIKGKETGTTGLKDSLLKATEPENIKENKKDYAEGQAKRYAGLPDVDPLNQSLLKSYFALRLLKTRDVKLKLMHTVNYFRAVQRIMAFEMRSYVTRERGQGERQEVMEPVFGKDDKGLPISSHAGASGPGRIFKTNIERNLDSNSLKPDIDEPITLKAYKYNNLFNQNISSTCPIVPKHHRTYGRPSLYEQVSQEIDKKTNRLHTRNVKDSMTIKRDRIVVNKVSREIKVLNEFGHQIFYYESLNDVLEVEEEILKIGSFYINHHEYLQASNDIAGLGSSTLEESKMSTGQAQERPSSLIDRAEIVLDLYAREFDFQFEKVMLIEQLMEVFEHTIDPLESVRVMQQIIDVMALRPRLNLESTLYKESYESEIEVLKQKRLFFEEFIQLQKDIEKEANLQLKNFQELKKRRVNEMIAGEFKYVDNVQKVERPGSDEEFQKIDQSLEVQERIRLKMLREQQHKIGLQNIQTKHITEFANEQLTDFAAVLGLPEISMNDLANKKEQMDPVITDSLRERAFFNKQIEGYPAYFSDYLDPGAKLGLHTENIGLTDFFESLAIVPKINAALFQALEEIVHVTKPETGLAQSCVELELLKEARLVVKKMRQLNDINGQDNEQKGQALIEEDFFFANSDKLIFAMKEFKADLAPENLYVKASAILVSKLDIKSVNAYNFPRILQSQVMTDLKKDTNLDENQGNDLIVGRMIQMAKNSVARQLIVIQEKFDDHSDSENDTERMTVKSPSMMRMCCNMLEVLRLREELIQRMHETFILKEIYSQQCRVAGKQVKIDFSDAIQFNVAQILKDFTNIVDLNDGKKLEERMNIDFMEFDTSLSANLDFKSDSCIKALFLDLGVEELRAILHYQVMQQHLLIVAVKTNQFLLDGPQQGLAELDLIEQHQITVPNAVTNINSIQRDFNEGKVKGVEKQERSRMRNAMSKSFSDNMYLVLSKKNRYRERVLKQFQLEVFNLTQRNASKPETLLRILRSYRLKIMHQFCNAVQRDIYFDSIKIQTITVSNQLRRKALLFPQNDKKLFTLRVAADELENLSFKEREYILNNTNPNDMNPQDLDSVLTAQLSHNTLFYVPSTDEILRLDRLSVDEETKLKDELVNKMVLDTENADSDPKNLCKSYTRFDTILKYKTNKRMKFNLRKLNFKEAFDYEKDSFFLLCYLNQIMSIFNLELAMGKNVTHARDIIELESNVFTGREFWGKVDRLKIINNQAEEKFLSQEKDSEKILQEQISKGTASQRVIERILYRKKRWIDLSEDMDQIRDKMENLNTWMRKLPYERKNLGYLCDMLVLQHQSVYYQFLNGLENILDIYRDKQNDEYFSKVIDVRESAIKRQSSVILNLKNGYYVTQAGVSPQQICLETSEFDDYINFEQAHTPIVDEMELIPKQVRVLRRAYGQLSRLDMLNKDCFSRTSIANYAELRNAFMNIDDSDRSEVFWATFQQIDEDTQAYLKYKNLVDPNEEAEAKRLKDLERGIGSSNSTRLVKPIHFIKSKDFEAEVLQAKVEMMSFKIEAGQSQRIMMSWMNGGSHLPRSTVEYSEMLMKYKDLTMMRILQERQRLNEIYWGSESHKQSLMSKNEMLAKQEQSDFLNERRNILDGINTHTPQFAFFNQVNLIRAESNVIKKLFDQKLIKIGIQTIQNEHASMIAAFEENGTDIDVQAFIHPQQQFASTLYQDIDKYPHLDIITKLGFVQHYLSRLRNRATEVETLTSGPGIVFTMKDFNECLLFFCKSLLKYGEEELRQRSETMHIMKNQYHHMIYLKEMEALYFRQKCEQFLSNIDSIINAKMSHKGNQIIYELDVTSRELRSLKDHYYLMEKYMREEVRSEFHRQISAYQKQIETREQDFTFFKEKMKNEYMGQVTEQLEDLQKKKDEKSFLIQTKQKALEEMEVELKSPKKFTGDEKQSKAYKQIVKMIDNMRTQKTLFKMFAFATELRHKKELDEAKEKLTTNSNLWEQLAESQKREQITRQELELTKHSLTEQENLIKKLYVQLEHLNNQKNRLQQYKNSKSKRIGELEDKMKDLEILENIDLQKILIEMQTRDKKILQLSKVENEFNDQVETMRKAFNGQLVEIKRKFEKEREAKGEAFEKLEAMRMEMKALEGKDIKNDLWKDKCKELYEISRELETENEQLRQNFGFIQQDLNDTKGQLAQSLNYQQEQHQKLQQLRKNQVFNAAVNQIDNGESLNLSRSNLRENMILNRQQIIKPMTAHVFTKKTRVFSGQNFTSMAATSQGAQTGNSTNASGGGYGLGLRARGNAIATSYDKFGKKMDPHSRQNLVSVGASFEQLNEGGAGGTSRGNTMMNVAEGGNTITSNMSFPGISSDLEQRIKPRQKHNGQYKGNAISNKVEKAIARNNNVQNQFRLSGQPGIVAGYKPLASSTSKMTGTGSAVLSGNVLQVNNAGIIGINAQAISKAPRLHTAQGYRAPNRNKRITDSIENDQSGKNVLTAKISDDMS